MQQIFLTRNKNTMVDDDVYEWASQYRWFAAYDGFNWYAARNFRKKPGRGNQGRLALHHAILGYPLHGLVTDHIDGNGLNNCRSNLRLVDQRTNALNRHTKQSSKYPYVYFDKVSSKWRVYKRIKGKSTYFGQFITEIEAYYKSLTI